MAEGCSTIRRMDSLPQYRTDNFRMVGNPSITGLRKVCPSTGDHESKLLMRRFRCRSLGYRDSSVLSAHRGLHSALALPPRLGVFIGVLRNKLRDVQDVEDFSANRALASPGPCVAAYRARLVLDLSQIVDSMISVFLGSRIVIEEAGSRPFRAADVVSVSAGQAESAGCPPAFVSATDFHRW